MARSKECPRLVKGWETSNFVGRSTCETWGHKRANCPQKHVNAVSVLVMPSSPPVQSSASSVAPSSVAALTLEDLRMMAVPFFLSNVENGESSCLDTGSEEHVCNPDFSSSSSVLSHPCSEMRDISDNVINNFGTNILDIKLPPCSKSSC